MTNAKLIWLNRLFNFIGSAGFLASGAGAVVELGGYADQVVALGIVPKKWMGIALAVGAAGHVAAKLSKTPSQAIAAAVPPPKPEPPAPPAP